MSTSFAKSLTYGLVSIFLVSCHPWAALAQSNGTERVFQIGEFNRSSGEFASGAPERKVSFVVSQSDAAKDWFSYQPAVLSSKTEEAGVAAAPRAITFSLQGRLADRYSLHVALLIENPSVPALKIDINGKNGTFYLHPKLDYNNGDPVGSYMPTYSCADVRIELPGGYLRTGANTITLEVIEEGDEAVPGAGVNYDAIELVTIPRTLNLQASDAQIVPTIFYQRRNGELLETVEAFFYHSERIEPGSKAALRIVGQTYQTQLHDDEDFGEERVEFPVREFTSETEAQLTVEIGGKKKLYKQSIYPAKKWTIFVVPHIHVDVGYSDYQAKVSAIQSRTISEAMDMTTKHPEFRFSLDGEWDLQQFLETRTLAQQQRVIEAIQKNQLYVPAQYANLLTGIATAETLIRSLYPSANFSRKYGTPFDYANITDVPSYSWSYASILASAGIHYLAGGSDNIRGPVLLQGRLNESSPMWWVGPDGKKLLLWYSRHYMHMQLLFGLPPTLSAGHDTLPLYLQQYENANYHASSTILYGTQVENTDLFPEQAELAQKWNAVYAYPHLQYAGFHEALQDIEKQFGDAIPTIRGDGGPYWEDGAASDAYYLAMERWNEARAQTAEKLATLAVLVNPSLRIDPTDLDRMWSDMVLMDEHTFDSHTSLSAPEGMEATDQLAVKEQYAVNARQKVDYTTKRSMANLADAIPAGAGSLIVFNSLNWKRSGTVDVDLDRGKEVVDTVTNQPVPYEVIPSGREAANSFQARSDSHRIRFLARDIPAIGYKVYAVQAEKKAASVFTANQASTLESPYYRVQLDAETGAIRSVYDKQLRRELVSQEGPYRFGEYLYVTGGDKAPNSILSYGSGHPKPKLEVRPSHSGRIVSVVRTSYGVVARMESEDMNTPLIATEVRLFDNEKKIELVENIDKEKVYSKEAAYFAFPFAMKHPQFQFEVQNGAVDPETDMYPGAGHEWFSVQHWVSVQQDGLSGSVLPLDAPMVTLGDINRGEWPEAFGDRPGTIFSYVMNNYWYTNYRAGQGGHFTFHYVITSAASTASNDLSRMGWEEITPLEADFVTNQDKAASKPNGAAQPSERPETTSSPQLDAKQGSFLEVADANLLLETWKPAEDGDGTIVRFVDLGGAERVVTARMPYLHLGSVSETDAVERGKTQVSVMNDNEFRFTIHPHEIVTIRLLERRE